MAKIRAPGKFPTLLCSSWLFLQHLQMMLAELGDLRRDHRLTIRLVGVVGEVFLVIIFGHVEFVELGHFGHDGLVPDVLVVQLLDGFLGNLLLFIVVIEDRGTILRADIIALAIHRGRIVDGKEDIQNILV